MSQPAPPNPAGEADKEPAAEPEAPPPVHPLLLALQEGVPGLEGLSVSADRGMTEIQVPQADRIVDICRFLRDSPDHRYTMLVDIVGIDYWTTEPRFGLAYILHSVTNNQRVYLKVRLPAGDPVIPTMTTLWTGANWMEREAFDMVGIRFSGHPDLRKVLTPDDLEGHPLRKDFPLGNVDIWPEGAATNVAR